MLFMVAIPLLWLVSGVSLLLLLLLLLLKPLTQLNQRAVEAFHPVWENFTYFKRRWLLMHSNALWREVKPMHSSPLADGTPIVSYG